MISEYVFHPNSTIVLVGSGKNCEIIKSGLSKKGIANYYVCDKRFKTDIGSKHISYNDIALLSDAEFIICSSKYCVEIYKKLKEYNVEDDKIFIAGELYKEGLDKKETDLGDMSLRLSYFRGMSRLHEYLARGWRLNNLDVFITERCTLKCKNCCALIPYYDNPQNYSEEEIFEGLDNLLFMNCFVDSLSIMGGEPFLNQKLMCDILKKYKGNQQIATFQIITNGTILPSNDTINVLREIKNVYIIFSNYGNLSTKLGQTVKALIDNDIVVFIEKEKDILAEKNTLWLDYGNVRKYNHSDEFLKLMYKECYDGRYCYSLLKNKLFICNRIAHGINMGIIPENGYRNSFDLKTEKLSKENRDKIIEECKKFVLSNEYPSACDYCNRGAHILAERALQL